MFKISLDSLTDELTDGERLDLWFERIPNTFILTLTWMDWRNTGKTLRVERAFDLGELDAGLAPDTLVHSQLVAMLDQLRESKKLL